MNKRTLDHKCSLVRALYHVRGSDGTVTRCSLNSHKSISVQHIALSAKWLSRHKISNEEVCSSSLLHANPDLTAMAVSADGSSTKSLIAIDLSSPDLTQSACLIRQACLDSGFFYVINHGIRQEVFEELFDKSRNFFQLPLEEKIKVLRNENFRGYTPLMDQTLDPSKQTKGDCKEGYYIGVEVAKDDPRATKRFFGPNVWPSADILPGWRQTMEKYHQEAFAFIVNIGDMLERWTNGFFRSTLHRVLLFGQERYSVAYFLEPGPDCLVECLPTCHSETNPPKHFPVKYGDYLAQRYKDTHDKISSSY